MVVGLEAFASHLEDRALVRAREAMQGGLDRMPRRARIVNASVKSDIHISRVTMLQSYVQEEVHNDEMTPVEAIIRGDLVEVRSGEIVPVDGVTGHAVVTHEP